MDADRLAQLQAADRRLQANAADMAAAFRRWNLGRYRDEVARLENAGRLALLAAIRRGAK